MIKILGLVFLTLIACATISNAETIYFEDNFGGSTLNPINWNTNHVTSGNRLCSNTSTSSTGTWLDFSNVPCHGRQQAAPYGTVSVNDGTANFSSSSNRVFPYVVTGPTARQSPFPATGDFTLEVRLQFDSIGGFGCGVSASKWENTDPVGTNAPTNGVFGIWADNNGRTLVWVPGKSVVVPNYTGFHIYRLKYSAGYYSVFIDNILVVEPTQSDIRPNSILIGNRLVVWWTTSNWTKFTIDYIRVTDIPSSPSGSSIIDMITPILASKKIQAISTTRKYFEVLKSNARVGDILLFNACEDTTTEPAQCSAGVMGVGYGYYQHAALIYKIEDNGIRVLQARNEKYGVGADLDSDVITPVSLVNYPYRMMALVRVKNVSDSKAQQIANNAYERYNNSKYDSDLTPFNGKMYCSELVWDAYNRFANIDLSDKTPYPYGGLILPDHIYHSSHASPFMTLPVPAW